ncbi:MAG: SoxR reducing system RseC family protein [Nitrospiraceae bacterium]|nr:SoxR reducing system RseC family protein [Nitrospiraceae bacterium]
MEDTGVVKDIKGGMVLVVVKKHMGCESCPSSGLCGSGGNDAEIEAVNQAGAAVGDSVRITFAASMYLKGALFVYGIPAVMLAVGAVLGKELFAPLFPSADPELVSAGAGFFLFAAAFAVMKFVLGRSAAGQKSVPVVSEIITRAADKD